MNELMMALVIWIAGVTGYPVPPPDQLPTIVLMTPANLKARAMGKNAAKSTYEVIGGYDVQTNEVFLRYSFNSRDVKNQADLVHELVHFLQAKNRTRLPLCENSDEVEAYRIENKWMEVNGLPPSVSEFHILMMSVCYENIDDAIEFLKEEQVKSRKSQ